MTRELIRITRSSRGRAKSSRPRRQAKKARRRGLLHVENVFGPQRRHRALQPAAIERVIGIGSYMQNKPNLLDTQMTVASVKTKDYENKSNWKLGKNKANTKPLKPNLPDAQMNVTLTITKHYENRGLVRRGENKPKQTQCLSKLFLFFTFLCPSYNLAMQNWTIQKLLNWVTEHFTEKGIDSPRLSAELLLSHVLAMKRIELYTQFDKAVTRPQLGRVHDLVERAGQNEPVAYLVGKTEFYSLGLNVSPDCMIPRPETELLTERAIEFLRTRPVRNSTMRNITQKEQVSNRARAGSQFVCDLCTGCGCIAVAIAKNFLNAHIIATDISDAALSIAAQNVEEHRLKERITLLCGDLFEPIMPQLDVSKFDLVVCNPPYVSTAEFEKLDKNIKDYEPKMALFAGEDGLDIYRRICEKADQFLKADAALMLEIGYAQGQAVRELLEQTHCFGEIKIEKDFHDNDRIVTAIKTSS